MKNTNKDQSLTYNERVGAEKLSIVKDGMRDGLALVDEAIAEAKIGAAHLEKACRKLWQGGKRFADAESADQFVFKSWWNSEVDWHADAVRREKREVALKVYRTNPDGEPKNLAECRMFIARVVQLSLEDFRFKRIGTQEAHERNLWNELADGLSSICSLAQAYVEQETMDKWPIDRLEKIVTFTNPVAEMNEQAKELLRGTHNV